MWFSICTTIDDERFQTIRRFLIDVILDGIIVLCSPYMGTKSNTAYSSSIDLPSKLTRWKRGTVINRCMEDICQNTSKCPFCEETRKSNGLHKHIKTHGLDKWEEYIASKPKKKSSKTSEGFACNECGFIGKTIQSVSSHWWRNHTEGGKKHVAIEIGSTRDTPAWNKGLTKDTDLRVKKNSESLSRTLQQKVKDGSYVAIKNTDDWRTRTSIRQSTRNSGGRCKWFEYKGVNLQGTWELSIAKKLDELNVKWQKVTIPWSYIDDNGKLRRYTPDLFLEEYNIFLEIKGYWWGDDKRKMELVIDQHKDKNVVIIQKEQYEKILLGELVW